ncbi:hypothetical protein ACE1B6_27565 [Aerosakkonemataceae cyanobacterium BLCC-F154]|uniref:Uncharacterized protein n=1 Tax=Floridaenema fluviatile BLCC-F154 TaxID=3153640 RepID=A0ABV4YLC3_9CYAN
MPQYTLAEDPTVILTVPGKNDTKKNREAAIEKLLELMDTGELSIDLKDGFSPDQLILVKDTKAEGNVNLKDSTGEDSGIVQAVQVLTQFASLRQRVEELRPAAQEARSQIDLLFAGEVSIEQIQQIKEGLKALKNFAQVNIQFRESITEAEAARKTLDEALTTAALENAALEKAAIEKATTTEKLDLPT